MLARTMHEIVRDYSAIISIAAILCLIAVFFEFRNMRGSAWISSPLALLFYVAGITQWLCAALVFDALSVSLTCSLQLVFLCPMVIACIKNRRLP
jgi:hypothetical protein